MDAGAVKSKKPGAVAAKASKTTASKVPVPAKRSRLPRGASRLPQELIVEIQKQRLLEAITLEVGENGFAQTSVAHIIERAGVSRKTFYELFSDKDECYVAAFQAAIGQHLDELRGVLDKAAVQDRLESLLQGHLQRLDDDPMRARAFFVGSVGAGALSREAAVHWNAFCEDFGRLIVACLGAVQAGEDSARSVAVSIFIGGLGSLIAAALATENARPLIGLLPHILTAARVPLFSETTRPDRAA